jgi:hypothetical protein
MVKRGTGVFAASYTDGRPWSEVFGSMPKLRFSESSRRSRLE